MAGATKLVEIQIKADTSQAEQSLQKLDSQVQVTQRSLVSLGGSSKTFTDSLDRSAARAGDAAAQLALYERGLQRVQQATVAQNASVEAQQRWLDELSTRYPLAAKGANDNATATDKL